MPQEEVEFLSEIEMDSEVPDGRLSEWHRLFRRLTERPGQWAIVRRFDDEKGAYWARLRIKRAADRYLLPGTWDLRSQVCIVDGVVQGSRLLGMYVSEEPLGQVNLRPARPGRKTDIRREVTTHTVRKQKGAEL